MKEFNQEYQYYKDDFDLEMMMKLTRTTYAKAKVKAMESEEWF